MSDLPRFENVDLTPTWDDVDPAALDFGVGAADIDVDAVELNPQPLPPEPEPRSEVEPVAEEAVEVDDFEPPTVEVPDDVGDEGAFWEQIDPFDGGTIQPETLPDDFDDLA